MPELTLPQQLERRDLERRRRYRENLDFYQGAQWTARARGRERQITFNYAKLMVEKTTSYLMNDLHLAVDPLESTPAAQEGARRAEEALRAIYDENNLDQLDFDGELDASVLGDGCYKVVWDAEERRVRVLSPDVQGIFAWWRADDTTQLWRVASRYRLSAEEVEALYGVEDRAVSKAEPFLSTGSRNGRAQEVAVVEVWTAQELELWAGNRLVETKANPYGFIPFIIYPNLREPKQFWGASDLPAVRPAAQELNRALSQLSMILELSGNPIAVLENVESAQDIAVQPGAVWEIPERARAYLLDLLQGGGVKLHVDYVELIYRALHDLGESPRVSFGDNPRSLSGVALEMELHPLLQKVRRKRLIRTSVYRRRAEMMLRLLEQHTGANFGPHRIRVIWGPVLPQDRSRQVRDLVAMVGTGLQSRRRAMDELGIDDSEAELGRWLEEQERVLDSSSASTDGAATEQKVDRKEPA